MNNKIFVSCFSFILTTTSLLYGFEVPPQPNQQPIQQYRVINGVRVRIAQPSQLPLALVAAAAQANAAIQQSLAHIQANPAHLEQPRQQEEKDPLS